MLHGLFSSCGVCSHCSSFSCCGSQVQSAGSRLVVRGLSCSAAWGIFLALGLNLCLPHWQVDSLPTENLVVPRASLWPQGRKAPRGRARLAPEWPRPESTAGLFHGKLASASCDPSLAWPAFWQPPPITHSAALASVCPRAQAFRRGPAEVPHGPGESSLEPSDLGLPAPRLLQGMPTVPGVRKPDVPIGGAGIRR